MRRGQSIGINVVIVAAIALLVLIVIALIVTSGARDLGQGTKSCVAQGGKCFKAGEMIPDGYTELYDASCGEFEPGQITETCYKYDFG